MDIVASSTELSKLARKSQFISRFLRSTNDRLKAEISRLQQKEQKCFLHFDSVLDLAEPFSKAGEVDVVVRTLLLCIIQLGSLILYVKIGLVFLEYINLIP